MDIKGLFTSVIFILPGAIAFLAAVFNWNWFYQTKTAAFFVDSFGRPGARLFYGALGLLLIFAALMILRTILG
ncbi:MAG: immunity 17 family protein [Bacteroidales bacterium]